MLVCQALDTLSQVPSPGQIFFFAATHRQVMKILHLANFSLPSDTRISSNAEQHLGAWQQSAHSDKTVGARVRLSRVPCFSLLCFPRLGLGSHDHWTADVSHSVLPAL